MDEVFGEARLFAAEEFLEIFNDDEELALEVLGSFLRSTESVLEQVRSGRAVGGGESLFFNVHKIKGSAANVRAERLSEAAAALEAALANPSARVPDELFDRLFEAFESFRRHIEDNYQV